MVTQRQLGPISGVPVRRVFNNSQKLSAARVHRPTQTGISGSSQDGSDSIVFNGGYADAEDHGDHGDHGDVIVYTGLGHHDRLWQASKRPRDNSSRIPSFDAPAPSRPEFGTQRCGNDSTAERCVRDSY